MASLSDAFKEMEGFKDAGLPLEAHQEYVKSSQGKYNKFTQIIQPNKLKTDEINRLFGSPTITNPSIGDQVPAMQIKNSKQLGDIINTNEVKHNAQKCEKVNNINCSAFDNPGFEKCGLCMKVGSNHQGKSHIGGLYMGSGDLPSLGYCPDGYLAKSKTQCENIKRKMECETGQKFGNGCSQCLDNGKFYAIDPTAIEFPSIFLSGNGDSIIRIENKELAKINLNESWKEIELEGVKERDRIEILVSSTSTRPTLQAYITGPTASGTFIMDLAKILLVDTETGLRPRIRGSTEFEGTPIMSIVAGEGKKIMQLPFNIPFTFLSKSDPSSKNCPSAPVILSEESAKEMNSSPCYSKSSEPGKYSQECLEEIYGNSGCGPKGSLAPSKNIENLLYAGDKPRKIGEIVDFLNNTYIQAATGKTVNGAKLSIEEWNKQSMMCTGKQITTPCDAVLPNGKLSDECIQYIYENRGSGKEMGATYTLNNRATLFNGKDAYCTRTGSAAPYTASTIEAARAKGGIDQVKKYFDDLHRGMFSANASNAERTKFTQACIGLNANVRDDLPVPIGIQARYIKFMRSPIGDHHIQISKLEVIDRTGRDVALKRSTEAKSEWPNFTKEKPVNGAEWFYLNMYHDNNQHSNPDVRAQEYWMVDLGEMKDVCLINYYNRIDCCQHRSKGTRMQLLDADKKVIREEVLDYGFIQSFSYIRDTNPEIIKKILLSYDNAISLVQYDKVRGKKLFLSYMQQYTGTSPNENDQTYNNINTIKLSVVPSSFRLRHSEKGRAIDMISLSPIGKPNTIIRHSGFKLSAEVPRVMELFRNDSTFKVLPGNAPGYVRLQSVNFPDHFIGTKNDASGKVNQDDVFILKNGEGNIEWAIEIPFQKNMAGPEVYLSAYRRYDFNYNSAQQRCASQGGRLATKSELMDAQKKGAQWCNFGHISDGNSIGFPMQVNNPFCGNRVGVFEVGRTAASKADVNCYGPKPSPDFVGAIPFTLNASADHKIKQMWSVYDK
jgi:hypothetical protein